MARGAVYLTRPIDRTVLVCTVAMAIMESRPIRRSERKRARVAVVVQGVPSQIIDVSRGGMRLEIPRTRKGAPPPPVVDVDVPIPRNPRSTFAACGSRARPQAVREAYCTAASCRTNSRRAELAWWTRSSICAAGADASTWMSSTMLRTLWRTHGLLTDGEIVRSHGRPWIR